jgi:ribonuclease-3
MARPFAELITQLGFDPGAQAAMWQQALTHRSAEGQPHYERLEFLGDAVLKLVVSEWLYEREPGKSEGEMTKVRARVVSDEALARVALRMELGEYLILGPAEKRSRGKTKVGTLASAFEALLGVIYLAHGYEAAVRFLDTWLADEYATSLAVGGLDNYKALLQELTQGRFKSLPEYRLAAEIGPEHDRFYDVEVWVAGERRGAGRGRSKKAAEQQAAQEALASMRPSETE